MTFLHNKGSDYSLQEVDCKLANGRTIKIKSARGGWMGPTKQRPYPDFEEVPAPGRIGRIDLYMGIASLFSERSTCLRGHVGCVAVKDNHIVAAGYNGAPSGMDECLDVGCGGEVWEKDEQGEWHQEFPNGCTRSIHAEQNMVAYAAKVGVSLDGCTVYSTAGPCLPCAQALIGCGMLKLVYRTPYRLPEGLQLVDKANITVLQHA